MEEVNLEPELNCSEPQRERKANLSKHGKQALHFRNIKQVLKHTSLKMGSCKLMVSAGETRDWFSTLASTLGSKHNFARFWY